jgi:hypothetical protein
MALWGNTDTALNEPKYIGQGQIVKFILSSGGNHYTTAPTITFNTPAGGLAATASCTLSGGSVSTVTILTPGSGYSTTTPPVATFTPSPSGAAYTASAVVSFMENDLHQTKNRSILFLNSNQAQLQANRSLGMKTPGWFSYRSYTDGRGEVRHKIEPLVAITLPESFTGKNPTNTIVTG